MYNENFHNLISVFINYFKNKHETADKEIVINRSYRFCSESPIYRCYCYCKNPYLRLPITIDDEYNLRDIYIKLGYSFIIDPNFTGYTITLYKKPL